VRAGRAACFLGDEVTIASAIKVQVVSLRLTSWMLSKIAIKLKNRQIKV
jgi:hypothetical protein